jgi:hypothetical protein
MTIAVLSSGVDSNFVDALNLPDLNAAFALYAAGRWSDAVGLMARYAHGLIQLGEQNQDGAMIERGERLRGIAFEARLHCSFNLA